MKIHKFLPEMIIVAGLATIGTTNIFAEKDMNNTDFKKGDVIYGVGEDGGGVSFKYDGDDEWVPADPDADTPKAPTPVYNVRKEQGKEIDRGLFEAPKVLDDSVFEKNLASINALLAKNSKAKDKE